MKRMSLFFGLVAGMLVLSLFLSSCGWFSDNPMFPTAKAYISATVLAEDGTEVSVGTLGVISVTLISNVSSESNTLTTTNTENQTQTTTNTENQTQTGTTTTTTTTTVIQQHQQEEIIAQQLEQDQLVIFARVVKFIIYPINAVGGTIEKCTIEYIDNRGSVIPTLTRNLELSVQFLPSLPGQFTLEIFTTEVERYFYQHGITSGQAIVTFRGTDSALHAITYKKTIPITCPPYTTPSLAELTEMATPTISTSTCQSCR